MKIEKAIEILTNFTDPNVTHLDPDDKDAIQLGKEALKFTKSLRDSLYISKLHLLLGEDKE